MNKSRPILFSGTMVRALLSGTKTQTRRIIRVQPTNESYRMWQTLSTTGDRRNVGGFHWVKTESEPERIVDEGPYFRCPYGQPGDRLWVKETWQMCAVLDDRAPSWCGPSAAVTAAFVHYMADGTNTVPPGWSSGKWGKTRASLHMPRWASRITLEITGARAERLQAMSEADAKAEGLSVISKDGSLFKYGIPDRDGLPGTDDDGWPWQQWERDPRNAYRALWEAINGPGSWDDNPFVWVIEFKQVTP